MTSSIAFPKRLYYLQEIFIEGSPQECSKWFNVLIGKKKQIVILSSPSRKDKCSVPLLHRARV